MYANENEDYAAERLAEMADTAEIDMRGDFCPKDFFDVMDKLDGDAQSEIAKAILTMADGGAPFSADFLAALDAVANDRALMALKEEQKRLAAEMAWLEEITW